MKKEPCADAEGTVVGGKVAIISHHTEQQWVAMIWQHTKQEDNSKMRKLYTSTYRDMSEYLQDFGFGGFVGYGRRVPGCLVEEELMSMKKMYQ